MSITTYSELKSAVADFLNRDDLTSAIPTFISLAEADFNRNIRHWRQEIRATAQIAGQYSAVPGTWLESIRFQITDNPPSELELLSQAEIVDLRESSADVVGRPRFYAMTGGQFEFYPTPGEVYNAELVYFGEIVALSDINTSNWLLDLAPDAYLYGSLAQAAPYLKDDARLQVWTGLYGGAVAAVNRDNERARFGGSGLRRRVSSY